MEEGFLSSTDVTIEEKIEVYSDVITLFTDFTDPRVQKQVKQNPKKQIDLSRRMVEIGVRIALFAGPEVVKKYVEWRLLTQGDGQTDTVVDCFAGIVLKMREDLAPGTSAGLTSDHVLGTFLTMDDSELKE